MLLKFAHNRALAIKRFEEFVANGVGQSVWDKVSHQVFLGSEAFVEKHQQRQETLIGDLSEIPVKQRRSSARSLEEYLKVSKTRNMAMCEAYCSGAYTLKEIAQHFNVHYLAVSRAVAKGKT
jgi:putative transposase